MLLGGSLFILYIFSLVDILELQKKESYRVGGVCARNTLTLLWECWVVVFLIIAIYDYMHVRPVCVVLTKDVLFYFILFFNFV